MSEKSIRLWLREAAKELRDVGIDSGRLDAEVILAHTLRRPRTSLHAHLDADIPTNRLEIADARLQLRRDRTPLAYIIGHKEFYGRRFKVTPATLIPRPETETLIELMLRYTEDELTPKRLIDVGTGTGCIGITLKLERPHLDVTLADTSLHALAVASQNAAALNADVAPLQSYLLDQASGRYHYIAANLPYVDTSWQRSLETNYEPAEALFATDHGLALIKKLLTQTTSRLHDRGIVILEADPRQHQSIIDYARQYRLSHIETSGFIISLRRDD